MYRLLGLFLLLAFVACKSEQKLTDTAQIEENVRNYFFLGDSVDVQIEITDTLYLEELEEFISSVNTNLNLVKEDMDTLSLMLDDQAYQMLAYETAMDEAILIRKNKLKDSLQEAHIQFLKYQVKQGLLLSKWQSYKQTNRILLNLQRSVWANVAGFNISVSYKVDEEALNFDLLLDANLRVID